MAKITRRQIEQRLYEHGSFLDLREADLTRLNLSQMHMPGSDLSRASMHEINLSRANLQDANLTNGYLSGGNLYQVILSGATLVGADLSRANLREATLRGANLKGTNMRGADVRLCNLSHANLYEANLTNADLNDSDLRDSTMAETSLVQADLTDCNMERATLTGADMQRANVQRANLREASLQRVSLDQADLTGADLTGADLTGADLRGTNLRGTNLQRATLHGARYNRLTIWPEGMVPFHAGLVLSDDEVPEEYLTSIWPGKPYPLGTTWDGQGVNFALFSENASRVELCLFDSAEAPNESARIVLPERTDDVWHVYMPGLKPGQVYAYRVYGPYNPGAGQRFNPKKLLIDPYAKALTGPLRWHDSMYAYPLHDQAQDYNFDSQDSGPHMPRCVVVDPSFPWDDDQRPDTPLHNTVLYELHVKGFTKLHPNVPEEQRGTYAGLASPAVIEYLTWLGVTAVELLPVHQHADERFLVERGLSNYWGYNTLSFFAPEITYSSQREAGEQVREFKEMVKALHQAGIEVILDVVYNHTAEGDHLGPTLSWRGIENRSYYRLAEDDPRFYVDYTGCGNSYNVLHPRALQLVMDSLRYWITEMHVDGFRFDLAAALARGRQHETDSLSAFLDIIHQDPVISQVKLIAEPWDIGPGGYQVGKFPVLWSEWNGKYRDTVRRFWRGDESQVAELAYRLSGSSDLYQHNGRRPHASINFITAHDGYTLLDLVCYEQKHNEANGENNQDGDNHNNSCNYGAEGPTDNMEIIRTRGRQMRNFMATLLLSQGVPMMLAGDELARTQNGNNNAYCQDNEISWIDWSRQDVANDMLNFTRMLVQIRKHHPVLCRRRFFQGRRIHGSDIRDIIWYRPDGHEMNDDEWSNATVRCIGMLLNGQAMNEMDEHGQQVYDDILMLILNAYQHTIHFRVPKALDHTPWHVLVDTACPQDPPKHKELHAGQSYVLEGRSLVLLRQPVGENERPTETT